MLRRKTKAERERQKIENAELVRRQREEGVSVITPDPVVVRALEAYDCAAREHERRASVPDPAPEPPVCEIHDWRPPVPFSGATRPPRSMCPGCREDYETKSRPGLEVYVSDGGSLWPQPQVPEAFKAQWERKLRER